MLQYIYAVVYGIIEGISEWLPISSTGHLILAEQFMDLGLGETYMSMFRVVIQLGAILAVVVLYFSKLWPFTADKSQNYIKRDTWQLWFKILVASVPAAVLGLLFDDWLDAHLYNAVTVGVMLIVYGVLFIVVEKRDREPSVTKLADLTYKQALIVGCWQVLAMIPGTSRSGATIVGGLLLGLSRPVVAEFTFFLAIPVMLGASGLKVVKYLAEGASMTANEVGVLAVAAAVAFGVSLVVIRFLMNFVKEHDFKVFGWYRILLGGVVLLCFAGGVFAG